VGRRLRRCRCRRWRIWRDRIRVRRREISEFGFLSLPFGRRRRNGKGRRAADPVLVRSLFFAIRRKVLDRAMHFVLEGTARQAKFATRLIAYSKKAEELTPDLSEVGLEILSTPLLVETHATSFIQPSPSASRPSLLPWPTTTTSFSTPISLLSRRSLVQHPTRSRIRASWSRSSSSITLLIRTRT